MYCNLKARVTELIGSDIFFGAVISTGYVLKKQLELNTTVMKKKYNESTISFHIGYFQP